MNPVKQFYYNQAQVVINNMKKRNFEVYYVENMEEAKVKLAELLGEKKVIGYGGSETIDENGVKDFLREKGHEFIVRENYKTAEERKELNAKLINADAFLMSSNAITIDGELVNIDGACSRVAFLLYGPSEVYVIAGMNKVVSDLDSAIKRIKNTASPKNTVRLNKDTPCAKSGVCGDCYKDSICCSTVITRMSRIPNRIKVILVGEELGY
ncbi:MAG: lactate utilization protein [Erysipelotrichaceae bacterium]|nr:lactate utilization protein [Erysipelotrichaceae bacterium]